MAYNPKHSLADYAISGPLTDPQIAARPDNLGRFGVATVSGLERVFEEGELRTFVETYQTDPATAQPPSLCDYGSFFHGEVARASKIIKPLFLAVLTDEQIDAGGTTYKIVQVRSSGTRYRFQRHQRDHGVVQRSPYNCPAAATKPVQTPTQEIPGARYGLEHISKTMNRQGWKFPER